MDNRSYLFAIKDIIISLSRLDLDQQLIFFVDYISKIAAMQSDPHGALEGLFEAIKSNLNNYLKDKEEK